MALKLNWTERRTATLSKSSSLVPKSVTPNLIHFQANIMKSTKVQTLSIPTRMRNISTITYYVENCTSIKISWQCGTKIMTCGNVSVALMLAMRVLFCSSLSKVCSCVSEALMLAMRVLLLSCLLNVSSRDSFAFRGTASSNADFSFQSEGMTTLTNRSPRVYHCAALRTYLPQAHTCTSVYVPHFTTNNEVNRMKLSLSLSSPLSSDAIFITCHMQLYVPGAVYHRILEILKKAESSLIDRRSYTCPYVDTATASSRQQLAS